MGKRKRPTNKALTQDEIWDDAALIRSWDEAVAEYEFYHSIAAKGEDVEEVLRLAELEVEGDAVKHGVGGSKTALNAGERKANGNVGAVDEELEDGEVDEDGERNLASNGDAGRGVREIGSSGPHLPATTSTATERKEGEQRPSTSLADGTQNVSETTDATGPGENAVLATEDPNNMLLALPDHSLNTWAGQDQVLENLKMAYWWAGYYSGLYEGQQQAKAGSTR